MKLKLIIAVCSIIIANYLQAQVTYANPEDFREIKKRPLIVELLELDTKQIEQWKKKASKADKPEVIKKYESMISEYQKFVIDYNSYIKTAVEKFWDLNSVIEYKTTSEVKALRTTSKKHTVLWFSESSTTAEDGFGFKYFPDLTIPTLNYSRIEEGKVRVDYSFFMPYTGKRESNEVKLSDLVFSLKLMKAHISEIEKLKKKKYTFKDFVKDQADENCKELSGKALYLNQNSIHSGTSIDLLKAAYKSGTVDVYTDEQVSKAIENEDDVIVGFEIPHQIAAGSVGPMSAARIMFYKSFINPKTCKIYTSIGTGLGDFNDSYFREKEFVKHTTCE